MQSLMQSCLGGLALAAAMTLPVYGSEPTAQLTDRGAPAPAAETDGRAVAEWLKSHYADENDIPEPARMLIAIAGGSRMGPGEGWFGPSQNRYGWQWLASHSGVADAKEIVAERFHGSKEWFNVLDRNRDGKLSPTDFDWSEQFAEEAYAVKRWFRKMDSKGNGRLSRDEWLKFFEKVSGGKEEVTSDELAGALVGATSNSLGPGDRPSTGQLVRGLFRGEIGSLQEGPDLNAIAPDFTLRPLSGGKPVHLADYFGEKPVVLVFGNYTCGPFRSMFPGVEQVADRFESDAHFLAVYVREAHPTDGWRMAANDKVNVAVAQPASYAERCTAASEFQKRLQVTLTLLVDEIDDRVGNAYSGMPARLYVLDPSGKIAYKGGRGPFGFKAGEMEQALVMCLMESQNRSPRANDPREQPE